MGIGGKIEIFKYRLVTKGFTQKEDNNYKETFLSLAMLKYNQILLSISTHDLEIW